MRNYEIMFIVRPTLTEEEIKKVAKNFEKGFENYSKNLIYTSNSAISKEEATFFISSSDNVGRTINMIS